MKYAITGAIMGLCTILILGCVMTISGRSVRQTDLTLALSRAVDQTVKMIREEDYGLHSDQEMLSDIMESVADGIDSESQVEVKIWRSSLEKGTMTVQAKAAYKHLNGKIGAVTSEKTVLWEDFMLEP